MSSAIEAVAARLAAAKRVVVLTGAGVSAESGVPTFRDAMTGLWARFRPEDLATPEAFRRDPKTVWEWYEWRRGLVAKVAPNPGHAAIATMERRVPAFTLVTQNVDGLHQRAGSRRVLELHGNILRTKCFEENEPVESWIDEPGVVPPRCPRCGAPLRPDVVWFGEALPEEVFDEAIGECRRADLVFTVGTSALVEPAASLPRLALGAGAAVVEVNPDETPFSRQATFRLVGPSGEILPKLVRGAWPNG